VREFLVTFSGAMKIEMVDILKLVQGTREAKFLLDAPTCNFIADVRTKALDHRVKTLKIERIEKGIEPDCSQLTELMQERHQLEKWLTIKAFELSDEQFKPFLDTIRNDAAPVAR
jgi:hypothetical protein